MQNYTVTKHGINFTVDCYTELLGAVSILCEDQDAICEAGCARCNEAYVNEVKAHFSRFDCTAITKALELFSDEYNFNYDAPVSLMLMLSNSAPIDREVLFRDRGVIPTELFDKFLSDLNELAEESEFRSFYDSHRPMYERIITNFIADYERYSSHEFLGKYLSLERGNEYYINFMLGITNANYGATVGNKVYANIRPYSESRYSPLPDYSCNPIYFSTLILHELAHSYVNKLTAQYSDRIKKIDISRHAAQLDELCYGNSVETLINETVIRALECLYVKESFGKYYDEYINGYIEDGFVHIPEVISRLSVPIDIEEIIEIFE